MQQHSYEGSVLASCASFVRVHADIDAPQIDPFSIGMLVGEGVRRRVSSASATWNNDPRRWVCARESGV